jgi:threonine/homoserine/homoserine lactone efflux protein
MVNELVVFLGVCFLLAMVPGPGAMVIVRQATRDSRTSAFMTLLGNETALLLWGVAAACGLTALIEASQVAYDLIRYAGAAVLIVLGIQSLVSRKSPLPPEEAAPDDPRQGGYWRAYSAGLLTNLMNPKAGIFAMSFMPQFVPHGLPAFYGFLLLAVLWALMDSLWFTGVIWGIGKAREYFTRANVWRRITQISGIVIIGLGVRVALDS